MDGRMERGRRGGFWAGGVGGQRLKLHHKSHPERKHEVVPPPFSIHLSPLSPPVARPSPLSSSTAPSPPFVSVYRECPMDGPGVFYITPSCTSNAKQTNFYSTPPLFIYLSVLSLPCAYQPVANHSADPNGEAS